jgi:hypothetical protein
MFSTESIEERALDVLRELVTIVGNADSTKEYFDMSKIYFKSKSILADYQAMNEGEHNISER